MIVGLSGYARAGKDTVASILVQEHGFRRVAFADALKAVLADLNPIVGWKLDERGGAHGSLERVAGLGRPSPDGHGIDWEQAKQRPEVRELLQRLGCAVRDHVGQNAWVEAALRDVDREERVVVSDVRFPNEAEAIKRRLGQVWRVVREGCGPVNGHVSESALDGWHFDSHVPNIGSFDDLRLTVEVVLRSKTALV